MAGKDYYSILEVETTASADEIRKAYRRLAIRWHPDKHPPERKALAEKKFKEIAKAYEILSDATKRAQYDSRGTDEKRPFFDPGTNYDFESDFQFRDADDVFREFFGDEDPFKAYFGDKDPFDAYFGGAAFDGDRTNELDRTNYTYDIQQGPVQQQPNYGTRPLTTSDAETSPCRKFWRWLCSMLHWILCYCCCCLCCCPRAKPENSAHSAS